ncbi:MAG: beta-ketoacyl synthase chain length factor [Myxococcota bacterium]
MTGIRVVAHAVRAPGIVDAGVLRRALADGRSLAGVPLDRSGLPQPAPGDRPEAIPIGAWRRMSPLSRWVAEVAVELLDGPAGRGHDRDALVTVWGTAFGELTTTSRFLERMVVEGADRVSPMAFQTSLFGTPLAHLSMALGLRGPSETVSAGGATSAMALIRGIDAIRAGAPAALVIAGDEASDTIATAWALAGGGPKVGEAVGAVLLAAAGPGGGPGVPIEVVPGIAPGAGPVYHRAITLPGEGPRAAVGSEAIAVEPVVGSIPAGGLAWVAAACRGGGSVVEQDGRSAWTVRVGTCPD